MTWTYDPSDLDEDTSEGRINVVRFYLGDTESDIPLLQDEEINFSLLQAGDNTLFAASYCASAIASKYAKLVTTRLDDALESEYGDLSDKYNKLSFQLKQQALSRNGRSLGIFAGGISNSNMDAVKEDTDRVTPQFRRDRFWNEGNGDY